MLKNIDYLLLDLDGTLLDFDMDVFISRYLSLIRKQFENYPFANAVPQWILAGTEAMLTNTGTMTNKEKFIENFQANTGLSETELWEIFIHFYQTDFDLLAEITRPVPGIQEFIANAFSAGYKMVIATQPVFPKLAIEKRLTWAGLDAGKFDLITHIENMSYCKPAEGYFMEILAHLNIESEQCIMIGNDIEMDMAAGQFGFETFFLKNRHLPNANSKIAYHSGNLNSLSEMLRI